jgi:hypothetical protein
MKNILINKTVQFTSNGNNLSLLKNPELEDGLLEDL